jgi:TonB-dependent starch-binding outer membrane protein SusC
MKKNHSKFFSPKSYAIYFIKILIVGILLIINYNAYAQQRVVSGTVTGSNNEPIPGVSVLIKGSTVGTTTGTEGKFTLSLPETAKILVFSFIGMQAQEVEIGSSNIYNVRLSESVLGLDEVIVIGYGTAKKSDLTGSVARVDGESIKLQAPTQATESLSGTVAGLYSNQATSAAGGGTLEIRGPSSLSAGTSPMIVLDGVIYNGSLSDINPADIATMDILKDASSKAVYGSKAASGVILITTNRGQSGKPVINFSSKVGFSTTTHDYKPFGPEDFLKLRRDVLRSSEVKPAYYFFNPNELPSNVSVAEWRSYSPNPAADNIDEWLGRLKLYNVEIANYKAGKTTDFYDLCSGRGLRQDYDLSVGGATKDLKYYWSIGYLNNEGIIKGDKFSTIRSRINLDLNITDWLNVGTNTQLAFRDESSVLANLTGIGTYSPYGSMYNEDGTLRKLPNDYLTNPLENYYGQDRLRTISTLFSSIYAQLSLPYGFSFRISFQPRFNFTKDFNFWSSSTTTGSSTYKGGFGRRDESSSIEWMLDNLLKWNKKLGVHNFDLTLLANSEMNRSWSSRQENSNFAPNENLIYNALQFGSVPGLSDDDAKSTGDALMARLNYTLLDKYLLTASIRRDGYSAFGQKNPRATFPALAFAWQIHKEGFYKIPWMNQLKLRLSWGVNGNRDIGAYSALARLGSVQGYDGSSVESGVYSTTLANPGLRWERTESYNVGLDVGLFKNRINFSVDAYDATTTDLLLNRQLPPITGFSSITSNLGELGNRGIEATLNTINVGNEQISWKSTLVFSMNRNKIKKLWGNIGDYKILGQNRNGELPDYTNQWFPGEARDVIWQYDIIGIWQLDETDAAAVYNLRPGNIKAADVNNDGKYTQVEDKKFIGYTAPRYRLGLTNEVTFLKNFSASLFIRADLGHLRQMSELTSDRSTIDKTNFWSYPYWSPENPTNDYNKHDREMREQSWYESGIRWYKPTGFIRIQDFNISYNLPKTLMQRARIQNLRVFCTIRNLLTFSKWPGFDPESGNTPMPKVYTFGLDLSI